MGARLGGLPSMLPSEVRYALNVSSPRCPGGSSLDGTTFYLPGTILGKALEPLEEGTGVILVLVTLQ